MGKYKVRIVLFGGRGVVQHLSPDFRSLMDELLARFTTMAIHRVSDPVRMRMNTIYLLPPRKEMVMEGGTLRVQSAETAKFDGMPRSAVGTGVVDAVLAPEDMPAVLLHYATNPAQHLLEAKLPSTGGLTGLPAVFDRLRQTYDLDFNLYKPATISRRLDRRVARRGRSRTRWRSCFSRNSPGAAARRR